MHESRTKAEVSVKDNIATSLDGSCSRFNIIFVRSTVLAQGTQERTGSCLLENILGTISYQVLGCPKNVNKNANKLPN